VLSPFTARSGRPDSGRARTPNRWVGVTDGCRRCWPALLGLIALAFTAASNVSAHNLDQRETYIAFDDDTLALMRSRATAGQPLLQQGDSIGVLLKSTPGPGTDTGVGGYLTFYIPEGTQVVGAEYLQPDGSGSFVPVPIKGQAPVPLGAGPVGAASTPALIGLDLGPNILGATEAVVDPAGVHRGTVAGV
jgi:hypothetical protein